MIEQVFDFKNQKYNSLEDIKDKLDYFRSLSQNGLHHLNKLELEKLKMEFVKFLNIKFTFFADTHPTRLFRVTVNKSYEGKNVRLQKITDLVGPPKGLSNYGRCNLQGESVFYAALDAKTAIWEVQPQIGDLITISEWEIKKDEKLNTHFIYHPSATNLSKESLDANKSWDCFKRQIKPEDAEFFEELIKFLSEEYMKKVKQGENQNYLFSANYSSRLIQSKPDSNGFKIEAICYPSIKMEYGLSNLAINNDCVLEKLNLKKITVYDVVNVDYNTSKLKENDFIQCSPMVISTNNFDYQNNRIIYNLDEELKLAMKLRERYY